MATRLKREDFKTAAEFTKASMAAQSKTASSRATPKPATSDVRNITWTSWLSAPKYDYGDVSGVSKAWQTTEGLRLSTGTPYTPRTEQQDLGKYNVYGEQARTSEQTDVWTLAKRNDIIASNLLASGKSGTADITSYLQWQTGFMEATPEEQKNTIRAIQERIWQMWATEEPTGEPIEWDPTKQPPAEMLADYGDEALRQAEYYTEAKQQEEYLKKQREDTVKITNLEWEVIEIQRSQRLREAEDQVADIKQNIGFLGTWGMPWVAAQHLDAMAKQISDAEQVYKELKQIETSLAQIRELGLDIDTDAYEESMRRLQVDLDNKVNDSIQNALDQVTATEMAGEFDTLEEVEGLRQSLFQNLDKVLMGEIVGNQRDRQLVIDQYKNSVKTAQDYLKNQNTVNTEMSELRWYAIDGNGNPILGANWQAIAMPEKAPIDPVFKDWQLITFSTWEDWQIQTQVQDVMSWNTFAQETIQNYARLINSKKLKMSDVPETMQTAVANAMATWVGWGWGWGWGWGGWYGWTTIDWVTDPAEIKNKVVWSILSATWLSMIQFNYLTRGSAALTRLPWAQRTAIMDQVNTRANDNGIDVATLQSQYEAYNDVLQTNINMFWKARVAETEILGTLDNLETASKEAGFKDLKIANVAKLRAGEQVNDATAAKYKIHLNQLRAEIAFFNAAASGKTSTTEADFEEASNLIKDGLAIWTIEWFREAMESTVIKMAQNSKINVDYARKNVWELFWVWWQYQPISSKWWEWTEETNQQDITIDYVSKYE